MKRFLVWLFTDAFSVEVDGVGYAPDWNAIGAVAGAAAVIVGLIAIWISIRALRHQLRHQTELEAKQLEESLLLRVMELAQVPYDATHDYVADVIQWQLTGGPSRNPAFIAEGARKVLEAHRRLSTATASALAVLRRSRPRRFPGGTQDHALERYDDLVQTVIAINARLLEYAQSDWTQFEMTRFQRYVGSEAFELANTLRRVSGELLARMYSEDLEWRAFAFRQVGESDAGGSIAFEFADEPPLGRPE